MSTFSVEFLGCKVSLTDAQEIRERLIADGHREVAAGQAEVRVVNTCCVTAEAVAKSRKAARRAARGAASVFVTGCAANLAGDGLGVLPGNVTVLGRRSEDAPEAVSIAVGRLGCVGGQRPEFARTRAYVKIQDGCSFGCSYCVIPQVRGQSRSRSVASVLAEARRRLGQGHRELVLTGINLGCFRDREAGRRLAGLLTDVAELEGVERVRLSSIEVNHLTDELLRAMAGHPRIAPHLHVPLQSGSDPVLRAMRRRYSVSGFLAKMARARELVPEVNLTSDVIVGHPAEDAAAFSRTLAVAQEIGFGRVHVFPYSPRPGTADAADDPVPAAEKRRRSEALRACSRTAALRLAASKVGRVEQVLVETGQGTGYSGDYTPFRVTGGAPGRMAAAVGVGVDGPTVLATVCA